MTSAFAARIFEMASRTAMPLETAEELSDELLTSRRGPFG